ncbi:hypothetical protein MK805_14330 [Shimazuella sp. AN120528]|uniref:hypothetical protein n=1 Tax=Shimazuella soli TaxID=1892854 RepID=UPI001F0DA8F6|nr:hypothetical protein [Shimazuella soli]MCH5586115.1 hypothetical protein [Shimazuella soli]
MDKRKMARDFVDIMDEMENVRSSRNFIVIEILILSAILGYYFHSWPTFFGSVIVLAILFVIPYLRVVLFVPLSVIWGLIAYAILGMFASGNIAIAGGVFICVLVFFIHVGSR